MSGFLAWLAAVPVAALYAFLFLATFVEGLVPPTPGDVAAAFLAFLVARDGGSLAVTVTAVTAGSIGGSVVMWGIGRRFGAEWITRVFHRLGWRQTEQRAEDAERRVESAYRRYGWVALFVSRFVPGVRGVVPAVAGALRLPFWEVFLIFTAASTLWYGVIGWIAFRVGADWEAVRAALSAFGQDAGLGAVAAALLLLLVFLRMRRRGPRA